MRLRLLADLPAYFARDIALSADTEHVQGSIGEGCLKSKTVV